MRYYNDALFLALNAGPEAPKLLALLAIIAATYLIFAVPLLLCAMWLWGYRADRFVAVASLVGITLAILMNSIFGLIHYEARPFVVGLGTALIDHRPNSSFPSNHASVLFGCTAVFAFYRHSYFAVAAGLIGAIVAWARIYVGIHYPLDMLGGAMTGILGALLSVELVMRLWGTRLVDGLESIYRVVLQLPIRRGWIRS